MLASDLRVALFSGNYNYTRDGPTQALNLLVGHLLAQGAAVRVYAPTIAKPAFAPTGDLISVPSVPIPGGRAEYRLATGLPASIRADAERFAADRLRALARTTGAAMSDTPEILVVCTHNAGRSVAARVLLDHYGAGRVTVRSAGSAPGDDINPAVAQILTDPGLGLLF